MRKFKHIILIDDQEITNFYNEYIFSQATIAENISVCNTTQEAIELLENLDKTNSELKNVLVFLDVNLPGYTGFEFIEMNQSLFQKTKEKGLRLFILSSSSNTCDIEKARSYPIVDDMLEKPLTPESIQDILNV